jgi:two-component system sensor histidine kinase/response regulator
MTAHATVEERARCAAAGMNDHVTKPIDPSVLYAVLGRYRPAGPASPPRVSAPAEDPGGALAPVEGLDADQGLRRVAGNAKLYRRLLRQFLDGQADAAEAIRESLGRGDRAVAERLAHTVKGTAGNLAAGPVQAAASALEKAIRDGAAAARIEELRAGLGEALGRLASVLRPLVGGPAAGTPTPRPPSAAPVDPAVLKPLVERWSKLLAECDATSVQDLEREGAALRGLFDGAEAFGHFAQLVSAYEFDAALETLRQAAANRGV